jgi:hypothetical protein
MGKGRAASGGSRLQDPRLTVELERGQNLFHYTTREAAFGHILPDERLRFSLYQDMRDPLENKSWQFVGADFGGHTDAELMEQLRSLDRFDSLANGIRRRSHLLSMTVDTIPVETPEVEPFCLGWARARMWEQYAETHQGVCLVFDLAALTEAVTDSLQTQGYASPYAKRVLYEPGGMRKPLIDPDELADSALDAQVRRYVEDHHDVLFFFKSLDWQTEYEFRFVTNSTDGEPLFVDFKDSLVGVILGEAFPLWQHESAEAACAKAEADVVQLDWSRGMPRQTELSKLRDRGALERGS